MESAFSCDPCSLTFSNEQEMIEHFCALPHHIKQSRSQPTSKQLCLLCQTTFGTLADYSRHLDTERHIRMLEQFRARSASRRDQSTSRSSYRSAPAAEWGAPASRNPYCVPPPPLMSWRAARPPFPFGVRPGNDFNTFARGGAPVPPPWYPPCLPQTLTFRGNTNFADDSFTGYMMPFQSPRPAGPPALHAPDASPSLCPPGTNDRRSDQTRRGRSAPSTPKRVIVKGTVTSIEPGVPLDSRHLGQSERRVPTTLFTKKKQREEHRRKRADGNKERKRRSEKMRGETRAKRKVRLVPESEYGAVNVNPEEAKSKQKRKRPKRDSIRNPSDELTGADAAGGEEQQQGRLEAEADSTTTVVGSSLSKRKSHSAKLMAAALLKRRRLRAQKISDRLLADRLNRYRLVASSAQSGGEEANARVEGNNTAECSSAPTTDVVATNAQSSPSTPVSALDNTNSLVNTTRIDASVRKRARDLFHSLLPAQSGDGTSQPAAASSSASTESDQGPSSSLREPKAEKADGGGPARASVTAAPVVDASGSDITLLSPLKQGSIPALKELWRLCKTEEQIRVEQSQLNQEMERLKGEMQRVWYRQKELQQLAAECVEKKHVLLTGVNEAREKQD